MCVCDHMHQMEKTGTQQYHLSLEILLLASNIKLLQSKFMKKLIEGEQPEPLKMHYILNYNLQSINYNQLLLY